MTPSHPVNCLIAELFVPEIKELLFEYDFKGVKNLLKSISIIDLADAWKKFTPAEQTLIFTLLSERDTIALFQELEVSEQKHLLASATAEGIQLLIRPDAQTEIKKLLHTISEKNFKSFSRLIEKEREEYEMPPVSNYPVNTVGSWMHPQRIELHPNLTTSQALDRIRTATRLRSGGGPDGYYITDKNGRLLGWLSLREIIAAPSKLKLSEYLNSVRLVRLNPEQDQEDAVHLFTKYQLSMAPVVDQDNKLLGYLRSEDILPLVQNEATEDIVKMAGTQITDFESKSVLGVVRARLPWLIATCAGGLLVSAVVKHFDFILGRMVVLASFMPIIAAMGGNVGSQASIVLVRALSLREHDFTDRWKLLIKEILVGASLGTFYGVTIGSIAYMLYGNQYGVLFAVVIGIGMLTSMTIATAMGVFVPLTLVRFGIDPATATGPLITTTTDIISVSCYFLLAFWLLI